MAMDQEFVCIVWRLSLLALRFCKLGMGTCLMGAGAGAGPGSPWPPGHKGPGQGLGPVKKDGKCCFFSARFFQAVESRVRDFDYFLCIS